MLSLKTGFPFASLQNKIVYVNDDNEEDDGMLNNKFIDIGNKTFQFIPPNDSFRLAVFGPSGAGKSTFVASVLVEYQKRYKGNKIYIISPTKDDPAYEKIKGISYIKIDDSLITDPMNFTEFQKCIFVMDDIEALSANKDINKAIELFRDQLLENGRKSSISTIIVNHVILNGTQTKKILNECQLTCVFPKSNFAAIQKISKNYWGFDKNTIDYLRSLNSRWCVVKSSYPQAILSMHQIKLV